jgi:hypothetical protein
MKRNVQKSYDRGYIYMPRSAILVERIERQSEAERFAWAITFLLQKFQLAWKNLGKISKLQGPLIIENYILHRDHIVIECNRHWSFPHIAHQVNIDNVL